MARENLALRIMTVAIAVIYVLALANVTTVSGQVRTVMDAMKSTKREKLCGKKAKPSKWTLYMLLLNNGHYYTGITTNIDRRLKQHQSGKGSKYVRRHLPCELAFKQGCGNTRSIAQKFEYKFKQLSHHDKEELSKFYKLLCAVDLGIDVKKAYEDTYSEKVEED